MKNYTIYFAIGELHLQHTIKASSIKDARFKFINGIDIHKVKLNKSKKS